MEILSQTILTKYMKKIFFVFSTYKYDKKFYEKKGYPLLKTFSFKLNFIEISFIFANIF